MKNTPHTPSSFADATMNGTRGPLPARLLRPVQDQHRREELARLLPLWPHECADLSVAGRRHIIRTLERALRAERRRGRAGHWAYDLSRHAALLSSWRLECAALREIEHGTSVLKNKTPAG